MPKAAAKSKGAGKTEKRRSKKGKFLAHAICHWLPMCGGCVCTTSHRSVPRNMLTANFPDPNAPKRGLSAYMFFANEQRDNVREENPGVSFGQVGKILGERWKALSDKQRAPYEAKAAADKKRYEDEKQAYNVSPTT